MKYISKTDAIAIAQYMAKKYASLGITDVFIDVNGDIVITYADGSTSTISGTLFMAKSVYDVYNRGKVDLAQNSERLGTQLPAYYTTSGNILYDNDISGLTAENVKTALDEIASKITSFDELNLSSGMATMPTFVENGDGSFTIGNATANLFTNENFTNAIQSYPIAGGTFTPTDNAENYLVVNYNEGAPEYQVITNIELINESTAIPVYSIYRSGVDLMPLNWDKLGLGLSNKIHQRLVKTRRFERESGFTLSEIPTRVVTISEGVLWYGAVRNIMEDVVSNTDICHFYYHVGGVYTKSDATQYNNTQYDNGTNLVTLNNNYYTVNWIYRAVEDAGHMGIVLGDQEYNQLSLAVEAQPRPDLPDAIKTSSMLVGRIIVQKGINTAAKIESAFDTTFITVPINTHNDLESLQGGTINEYYHLTAEEHSATSNFQDIKRYGFTDLTETTISFDGVNTFTLAKTDIDWSYYRTGKKHTITSNKTVNLSATPPAATGLYYIYIDDEIGTLSVMNTSWTLADSKVPVAIIYWNNALTPKFQLSEERHTCLWDRQTHRYHHLVDGTKLIAGSELTGYVLNSSTNTNKVFAISQAAIADEDLFLTLAAITKPDAVANAYTNVYRSAPNTWVWTRSPMPFKYTTTGFVQYDNNGVMTPITVNNYMNTYLLVSNIQGDSRFIIVSGQAQFSSSAAAYAERFETFNLTGFITAESVALYQLTWRGVNNAGLGQCQLTRVQKITVNIVATNIATNIEHNGLIGLQGGIANEYYHLTATEHDDLLANRFWALLGDPVDLSITTAYQKIINTDTLKIPTDTSNYFTLSPDKKDITCLKAGVVRITRTITVESLTVSTTISVIPTVNNIQTAQALAQEQKIYANNTTTKDIGYSYYLSVQANDVVSLWGKATDATVLAYTNARTTIEYI